MKFSWNLSGVQVFRPSPPCLFHWFTDIIPFWTGMSKHMDVPQHIFVLLLLSPLIASVPSQLSLLFSLLSSSGSCEGLPGNENNFTCSLFGSLLKSWIKNDKKTWNSNQFLLSLLSSFQMHALDDTWMGEVQSIFVVAEGWWRSDDF